MSDSRCQCPMCNVDSRREDPMLYTPLPLLHPAATALHNNHTATVPVIKRETSVAVPCSQCEYGHAVSTRTKPWKIGMEGGIGVGKSTGCNVLKDQSFRTKSGIRYTFRPIMETILPELLQLFYSNKHRYAWSLQYNTVSRRSMTAANVDYKYEPTDIVLYDRAKKPGDLVFLLKNYLSGYIDAKEVKAYQNETALFRNKDVSTCLDMDAFVYLHSTAASCQRNVTLRNDPAETNIQEDYLKELLSLYIYMVIHIALSDDMDALPVYIVDWRKFGDPRKVGELIRQQIVERNDHKFRAKIQWDYDRSATPTASRKFKPSTVIVHDVKTPASVTPAVDIKISAKPEVWWKRDGEITYMNYDSEDVLEPITDDNFLPRLQPQWRVLHSQAWIDRLMEELSNNQTVRFIRTRSQTVTTLLDMYRHLPELFTYPDPPLMKIWKTKVFMATGIASALEPASELVHATDSIEQRLAVYTKVMKQIDTMLKKSLGIVSAEQADPGCAKVNVESTGASTSPTPTASPSPPAVSTSLVSRTTSLS